MNQTSQKFKLTAACTQTAAHDRSGYKTLYDSSLQRDEVYDPRSSVVLLKGNESYTLSSHPLFVTIPIYII